MNIANRLILFFIALSGAFSVLFSAWLAHKGSTLDIMQQKSLASALNMQFIHTLALLSIYVWYTLAPQKLHMLTISLLIAGILLFSGMIYLKTLAEIAVFGKLTPFGGILLALAWLSLIFQRKDS